MAANPRIEPFRLGGARLLDSFPSWAWLVVLLICLPGCSLFVMGGKMLLGDMKQPSQFHQATQFDLAKRQMSGGGTVITFELDTTESAAKHRAFEVLDKLRLIDISNNLGDAKSLITHPATTTHRAMGPEGRAAIGLGDGVVRISVGLEDTDDLIADIDQALG